MNEICAVSTPMAEGGISVIRISGDRAPEIAARVFKPLTCPSVEAMAGYTCAHGEIIDRDSRVIDDGVLTVFRAPRSYTGENVCELSCHGGLFVTKKVLRLCVEAGARLAAKGEFTKRALLNGKLTLTQAEAVMDTISAEGEYALASAGLIRGGRLFSEIDGVSKRLIKLLGELAAWVDYPEDDIPEVENDSIERELSAAAQVTGRLLSDYDSGLFLRSGVDTVIAGKPNVGKSTLMNLLLGYDRSIVTDIAGTTRDVIRETAVLGGLTLRLSDTAGLRQADDEVERIGVDMARKRLAECMFIIAVFDSSEQLDSEDMELLEYIRTSGKRALIVLNKSDIAGEKPQVTEDTVKQLSGESDKTGFLSMAAKDGSQREKLCAAAEELFRVNGYDPDSTIFANERQRECALRADEALRGAAEALRAGETLDAVTVMISKAEDALLELTGEKTTEAVLDEVFSKFCVGK
ncbi:MAG: tRNA uridine-5-carboxymethylaminomethyl(34) synthesis GTPase MnmE [Ruminococcus sp.]|nr:tRNA uridine-5-carboxymethylaminomethyl(34) synthesis GTPase MnmE [Ruminococcus sp.]